MRVESGEVTAPVQCLDVSGCAANKSIFFLYYCVEIKQKRIHTVMWVLSCILACHSSALSFLEGASAELPFYLSLVRAPLAVPGSQWDSSD